MKENNIKLNEQMENVKQKLKKIKMMCKIY